MIKVLLFGIAGRMGRLVAAELDKRQDIYVAAGVEHPEDDSIGMRISGVEVFADGSDVPAADVWLDFSLSDSALKHVELASRRGKPMVVAATGFNASALTEIEHLAKFCPVLLAPNLSKGIGVMDKLIGEASKLLGDEFEPGMFELHHSTKSDSPSGTAKLLAHTVKRGAHPIRIAALRLGGAIGEHQLRFVGKDEELIITHRAWSRKAFSSGVPHAIRFILDQDPGLYEIQDMY